MNENKDNILRLLNEIRTDMNLLKSIISKKEKQKARELLPNIYAKFSQIEIYAIELEP